MQTLSKTIILLCVLLLSPPVYAKIYRDADDRLFEQFQLYFDPSQCNQLLQLTGFWQGTQRITSEIEVRKALCYVQKSEIDLAIDSLNRAIQLDPDNADAYNNLGSIYLKYKNNINEALSYYQSAIKIKPENLEYRINEIIALESAEQFREAQSKIENLLKTEPRNAILWVIRGNIFYSLGNLREAFFSFNKAYWYNPRLVNALANRGVVRIKMGNKHWGCRDLQKARQEGSDFAVKLWDEWCQK